MDANELRALQAPLKKQYREHPETARTAARAERPRTYDTGEAAFALRDAGWAGANDSFQSDMDVTDHQNALVEYENEVRLSFHANSQVEPRQGGPCFGLHVVDERADGLDREHAADRDARVADEVRP